MSILLTGGAGYIGSHVLLALKAQGLDAVVLDNLSTGHREFVDGGPFVQGDVRDMALLDRVLSEHSITAVVHLAGASCVQESVGFPERYYGNNVMGMLTLLTAMEKHGIRTLVLSSSAAVYGHTDQYRIDEECPTRPVSPYGHSKVMVEQIVRDWATAHSLRYAILRYFNVAGADPSGRIGEWHEPETHLIPLALRAARDGRTFRIFGADYPTPDGSCVRDFTHVNDIAEGHLRAHALLQADGANLTLNLGSGVGTSVMTVLEAVEAVVGKALRVEVAQRRPGDPARLVADIWKAEALMRWRPQLSRIENIVEDAWNWERRRPTC